MPRQLPQGSRGEIRRVVKSQLDVAPETSREGHGTRAESGDPKDARAFGRTSKPFIDADGEFDAYGGMGENDSLGG